MCETTLGKWFHVETSFDNVFLLGYGLWPTAVPSSSLGNDFIRYALPVTFDLFLPSQRGLETLLAGYYYQFTVVELKFQVKTLKGGT